MHVLVRSTTLALVSGAMLLGLAGPAKSQSRPGLARPEGVPVAPRIQACIDAWQDSAAHTYCPDASIDRISEHYFTNANKCTIEADCSISVTINGGGDDGGNVSHEFTPAIDATVSLSGADDFDICFKTDSDADDDYGWSARVSRRCSGGTTSADATAAGLADNSP